MPKVHITKRFERHRIVSPSVCIPGTFRYHDIGRAGYSARVACIRKRDKKWITQAILIDHREPPEMKKKLREKVRYLKKRVMRI